MSVTTTNQTTSGSRTDDEHTKSIYPRRSLFLVTTVSSFPSKPSHATRNRAVELLRLSGEARYGRGGWRLHNHKSNNSQKGRGKKTETRTYDQFSYFLRSDGHSVEFYRGVSLPFQKSNWKVENVELQRSTFVLPLQELLCPFPRASFLFWYLSDRSSRKGPVAFLSIETVTIKPSFPLSAKGIVVASCFRSVARDDSVVLVSV